MSEETLADMLDRSVESVSLDQTQRGWIFLRDRIYLCVFQSTSPSCVNFLSSIFECFAFVVLFYCLSLKCGVLLNTLMGSLSDFK